MTKKPSDNFIITIDGPAAAGKSTVARRLADRLGFRYLDTGALYRAFTLKVLKNLKKNNLDNVDLDFNQLIRLFKKTNIYFKKKAPARLIMDGRDSTAEIRKPYVTANVYRLAESPLIRQVMMKLQRRLGQSGQLVAEGRDLGTVVFPQADLKFYLDASLSERTARRLKEFKKTQHPVSLKQLGLEIKLRDRRDKTRAIAPLKPAQDSIYINTSHLSINEAVSKLFDIVKRVFWMKFIPEKNRNASKN